MIGVLPTEVKVTRARMDPWIPPEVIEERGTFSEDVAARHTHALWLLPHADFDPLRLPHGAALQPRLARLREPVWETPFVTDLPNAPGTRVSLLGIDPSEPAYRRLEKARLALAAHAQTETLAIAAFGLDGADALRAGEAVLAAALAAGLRLPHFGARAELPALRRLHLFGLAPAVARLRAEAEGNNLARFLTALPVNELTPAQYRQRVRVLARQYGWGARFLDLKQLKARGAGAFLAVARGSAEADAGLLHLRYRPRGAGARPGLALVGKGICFDTGGTNLKSAKGMYGMHEDMEGSAVALGVLVALTRLKADFPVDCWLALAQNRIGPKAYTPNEVVRAANGTAIEIVHTDAEGRLVLADALTFACASRPALVIDYATLTGSCVQALGTRMSGGFTNRPDLVPALIAAGQSSGERVWPFPLDDDYAEDLKSEVADVRQCRLENEADHILAAVFLKRFLAHDPAWVHLDLSSGNHKGGLAHVPTDVTGAGVRFTLNLLFEQGALTTRADSARARTP